jgi:hypothetical protein
MAVGADNFDDTTHVFSNTSLNPDVAVNTVATTSNTFNFNGSNVSSFGDNWNMYFAFEDGNNTQYYKLGSAVVNSVSMDFDIDGIATISWSGFAKELGDEGTVQPGFIKSTRTSLVEADITTILGNGADPNIVTVTADVSGLPLAGGRIWVEGSSVSGYNSPAAGSVVLSNNGTTLTYQATSGADTADGKSGVTVSEVPLAIATDVTETSGLSATDNFIRNRISTVSLVRQDDPNTYNLVLTGGSFTLENNINYLTPEELGVVNAPLANITGARSISGSLTCYLDNDKTNSKSGELFADLVSDTSTIRNVFDMAINIGGVAANTPRLIFDLPTAHLEIPTINVEDLLTLEVNFHGQVQGGNVDLTNEATIQYKA